MFQRPLNVKTCDRKAKVKGRERPTDDVYVGKKIMAHLNYVGI